MYKKLYAAHQLQYQLDAVRNAWLAQQAQNNQQSGPHKPILVPNDPSRWNMKTIWNKNH